MHCVMKKATETEVKPWTHGQGHKSLEFGLKVLMSPLKRYPGIYLQS